MKTRIHINQHKIKSNKKNQTHEPVITVKTYKSNEYGNTVVIYDDFQNEVARVVYSPGDPLSCGAQCWVETSNKVEIL